jgi:hypothetical protein
MQQADPLVRELCRKEEIVAIILLGSSPPCPAGASLINAKSRAPEKSLGAGTRMHVMIQVYRVRTRETRIEQGESFFIFPDNICIIMRSIW